MRRALALLLLGLTLPAVAGAGSPHSSVTTSGRVIGLQRTGPSVALAWLPGHDEPCQIALWNVHTGRVTHFGKDNGCETHSYLDRVTVAGHRLLWNSWTGDYIVDWKLWTATTATARTPRLLRLVPHQPLDGPFPIIVGTASGEALPYAVGKTLIVISPAGKRLYTWRAPGRVTNIIAYRTQIAAFYETRPVNSPNPADQPYTCVLLSRSGSLVWAQPFAPGSVRGFGLANIGLIIEKTGGKVEIRRNRSIVKTLKLPRRARIDGYAKGILLYDVGHDIHARRISTGQDVLLRNGTWATLVPQGFTYVKLFQVYSVPMRDVLAAFR